MSAVGPEVPESEYAQAFMQQSDLGPEIDVKLVESQKQRAMKELDSRIKMAVRQHDEMFKVQRQHIISDHERQLQMARTGIEANRKAEILALEHQYQAALMGLAQQSDATKLGIEQEASFLSMQALQQKLIDEHQNRSGAQKKAPERNQTNTRKRRIVPHAGLLTGP